MLPAVLVHEDSVVINNSTNEGCIRYAVLVREDSVVINNSTND